MKLPCTIWFSVSLVLIQTAFGQGFVNLDFELARVPYGAVSGELELAQALPGWTATIVGPFNTNSLYDLMFLDSAAIGIIDTKFEFARPIGGKYTAMLQSGIGYLTNGWVNSDSTLSQTGLVPVGTKSLRFKAKARFSTLGTFAVTLGGQTLSLTTLGGGTNYTLYAADVSQWAGQTAQLSFTVFAENPHQNDELFFWMISNFPFSLFRQSRSPACRPRSLVAILSSLGLRRGALWNSPKVLELGIIGTRLVRKTLSASRSHAVWDFSAFAGKTRK